MIDRPDLSAPKPDVVDTYQLRPYAHQLGALEAWHRQSCRGIINHATGSGKTLTAILAIRDHINFRGPALVVVPSRLLLRQWRLQIAEHVRGATILIAGDNHNLWRRSQRLESMTANDPRLGRRIVLATIQTASSENFLQRLSGGEHLLLVADEVHQTGSRKARRILSISSGCRLGLSATPNRFGDPEGTKLIFDYFGAVVPYTFTLGDAINSGALSPYRYYPHPVHLTATEADAWRAFTIKIAREVEQQQKSRGEPLTISGRLKRLMIHRARIAKKARGKLELANRVIRDKYQRGQHWLVYCEDRNQLFEIAGNFRASGFDTIEYHSSMTGNAETTLEWFRRFGGILVSIRCLDEGVDIPQVTHALILASSQNPRQFIQRRGRVLRLSAGKHVAIIHDAIVTPVSAAAEPDQTALLRAELARAMEFSSYAENRNAGAEIREIAIRQGVRLDDLATTGIEIDEHE